MLTCHNVRMPRTGAKKGEAELENDTDHCRTPLQTYEQILRTKLPDYSMENVSISSTPLPETRSRVWILGSRNPSFSASTWKSLVLHLEAKAKEMVRHHFHSLSGPPPVVRTAKATRGQEDWERDAEYHVAFKKAFKQAAAAGRLGKDTKPRPKPKEMRASAKAKCRLTPRQMAAVDVCEQIMEQVRDASHLAACRHLPVKLPRPDRPARALQDTDNKHAVLCLQKVRECITGEMLMGTGFPTIGLCRCRLLGISLCHCHRSQHDIPGYLGSSGDCRSCSPQRTLSTLGAALLQVKP